MKKIIILSAPSGSGKTTLCKAVQKFEKDITWSVSYTTRKKRDAEKNGIDYNFISKNRFTNYIKNGFFIEWEDVHGFLYGTAKETIDNALLLNKLLLMDLDVKGTMKMQNMYPNSTFSIFIIPPSINKLRHRLKNRGTDSEERIEIRLNRFKEEMKFQNKFDHVIINEDLEKAKSELIKIINKLKKE